jgi:hypothetical protein
MNNIMKKKILVSSLSVFTVTFLCVFALMPIAQAQSSGAAWSGNEFCERPGGHYCLPEIVVKPGQ